MEFSCIINAEKVSLQPELKNIRTILFKTKK